MAFRRVTLLALMAVALCARVGDAQTSRAAAKVSGGTSAITPAAPAENVVIPAVQTTIRRPVDSNATTRHSGVTQSSAVGFDTGRVVLSLAIVLFLIFVLRWLSQRMFGKTVAGRASRAVQVLSRNVISPKQQLLVVQVGRRLLVVGDSGQQMNALCEITDPQEMAALIGQIHEEKRESTGRAFGALFGQAGSNFGEKESEPPRPPVVADEDDDGSSTGPSGVQETRDELSGLMDTVRGMSRQFRRT